MTTTLPLPQSSAESRGGERARLLVVCGHEAHVVVRLNRRVDDHDGIAAPWRPSTRESRRGRREGRARCRPPPARNVSTTLICSSRSSSRTGPFQMTSAPSSRAAFSAPACTDFQYSWVVPLGMTAILPLRPRSARLLCAGSPSRARRRTRATRAPAPCASVPHERASQECPMRPTKLEMSRGQAGDDVSSATTLGKLGAPRHPGDEHMKQRIALFWPGDAREKPNELALPNAEEATQQLEKALSKPRSNELSRARIPCEASRGDRKAGAHHRSDDRRVRALVLRPAHHRGRRREGQPPAARQQLLWTVARPRGASQARLSASLTGA